MWLTETIRRALPPSLVDRLYPSVRAAKAVYWAAQGLKPTYHPFRRLFPEASVQYISAPETVATPEVAAMRFVPSADYLLKGDQDHGRTYTTPPDYIASISDVLYCPMNGVLMDERRRVVEETVVHPLWEDVLRRKRYRPLGGVCTVLHQRYNTYFHAIVDNVLRVAALTHSGRSDLPGLKLLCSRPLQPMESYLLDRLAPPGYEVVHADADYLYRLNYAVLSTFKTGRNCGYIPALYRSMLTDHVRPSEPSRRTGKYFLSREGAAHRKVRNKDAFRKLLDRHGYQIVDPSTLPPAEQISMFYHADTIVAAHGAGLANTIFARFLNIIELFPSPRVTPTYYYVAKSMGHTYRYWCGSEPEQNAEYFDVDVSAVDALLQAASGHNRIRSLP